MKKCTSLNEVLDRIRKATKTSTQAELARLLEIRPSSMAEAIKRNSIPAEWYLKLFEKMGLNPEWLKKGTGPVHLRTEYGYITQGFTEEISGEPRPVSDFEKCSLVQVYSMRCAFSETMPSQLEPLRKLVLPMPYVERSHLVLYLDNGSFEPLLHKKAYIGVDRSSIHSCPGEIYALFVPYEGIVLKRLFFDLTGKNCILKCDAPGYPDNILPFEVYEKQLLGRLSWVLQPC